MKRLSRLTALLLALLMLLGTVTFTLSSCIGGETPPPVDNNPPDDTGNESTAGSYTVTVKTAGGMKMSGVALYVYPDADLDDDPVGAGTTDENGVATIRVSAKTDNDVVVVSKGIPNGYDTKSSYKLSSTGANIVVTSSVITNNTSLRNVNYKLGDVMRDFTFTTTEGKEFTLSEVLKEKDMVLINFWYVDCSACQKEFPYMQSVYASQNAAGENYSDNVAIIAVNPLGDSLDKIKLFQKDFGLTFDVAAISSDLSDAFAVTGYPTSVVVDRYGVITLIEKGALPSEKPFRNIFDYYTGDEYEQQLFTTLDDLTPQEKPNVEMPSSEAISEAFDGGSLGVTYRPETEGASAEYSWPFIITEKDGEKCIKASNAGYDSAFATLYVDITLKAGEVISFEYFSSSEQGADILYVIVDRDDIYQISGVGNAWKTCYAFVAPEDGTYELALCYMKDSSDAAGDDTVYLKNLHIVDSADKIDIPTYIPRNCATNQDVFGVYQDYAEIFYNEADGYYHVGSVNGPLLLANLMGYTLFSGETSVYYMVADGTVKLSDAKYERFIDYCNYASNSAYSGYCTVTAELRDLLVEIVSAIGVEQHDNEWLQLCSYYNAYGTGGVELGDPIQGLATFSAYSTVVSEKGTVEFPNSVYYDRVIMPRGLLFKFTPETSGTYLITSTSEYEANAWIFDANYSMIYTYDNVDRMNFDVNNVYIMYYFEAGVDYYIDIAFYDVYQVGEIKFRVERWGDAGYHRFTSASPGYFTYVESEVEGVINKIISGGIAVELGNDGYWREKRTDGREGSLLYADFTYPTNIFSDKSLQEVINAGGFNFSLTEYDQYVLNVINSKNGDLKAADEYLKQTWGDDYDEYREIYRLDDVFAGKYHGTGKDYTEEMKTYLSKIIKEGNDPVLGEIKAGDARIGCVLVDARLAELLQMLMDKYTFAGVENSWTKLCYYHEYFGPASK